MSITDERPEKKISVELTETELRYLVSCGFALLQHIPANSLSTYSNMSKNEITEFSKKIRCIMDDNKLSM